MRGQFGLSAFYVKLSAHPAQSGLARHLKASRTVACVKAASAIARVCHFPAAGTYLLSRNFVTTAANCRGIVSIALCS